jgi:hypothetical protein
MKITQDFLEKAGILLLTALLTGFLAPYVLKRIDETKAIEQKMMEADLSRQTKLIEAQSKFLDDTTEAVWAWRYLSMKVAFNGAEQREAQYALARKEYEAGIWDVLARIRNQTSKSQRLVSETGYRKLVALYDQVTEFDARLDRIVRDDLPTKERSKALAPLQREIRVDLTKKLDETLDLLAQEVHLKAPDTQLRP